MSWYYIAEKPLYGTADFFHEKCILCWYNPNNPNFDYKREQCDQRDSVQYADELRKFCRQLDYPYATCYGCGLHIGVGTFCHPLIITKTANCTDVVRIWHPNRQEILPARRYF